MTRIARSLRHAGAPRLIAVLFAIGAMAATGAASAREFGVSGIVDCGLPSGRRCGASDTLVIRTRSLSGDLERVAVDISWIARQLPELDQDDEISLEVETTPDGALRALRVIEPDGVAKRPTPEKKDRTPRERAIAAVAASGAADAPTQALSVTGGTYFDFYLGVIGTAFAFDPSTPSGLLPFIDIEGPTGWNGGRPLRCSRYQPQGTARSRAICWTFGAQPVSGRYVARALVDGQTLETSFSVDAVSTLRAPEIIRLDVEEGRMGMEWVAPAEARSLLVRVNDFPGQVTLQERVLPGEQRAAALGPLPLIRGNEYQAVVFAFSLDIRSPGPLSGPFNMSAHGPVFTAP